MTTTEDALNGFQLALEGHHYCPAEACDYYGWVDRGNIRANGHPNGGPWRQLECVVCGKCFMETHGTLFYGRRSTPETIWRVLKALAEGLGIQGTARLFDLDPNTVEGLLGEAAQHMTAVSRYLIHDLHLSQVQVDEMWALLGRHDADAETQQKSRGVRWVWAAIDPVSKLLLATSIGDRSETSAQRLIHTPKSSSSGSKVAWSASPSARSMAIWKPGKPCSPKAASGR